MDRKSIIQIIIIAIIAVIVFLIANQYGGNKNSIPVPIPQTNTQNTAPAPSQSSINPIDTNLGSISGVDLSVLGTEANESGQNSLLDGASDSASLSSGNNLDSMIDSANNPIQ